MCTNYSEGRGTDLRRCGVNSFDNRSTPILPFSLTACVEKILSPADVMSPRLLCELEWRLGTRSVSPCQSRRGLSSRFRSRELNKTYHRSLCKRATAKEICT